MDYYYKKFSKLQEKFHDAMHDYPLFSEIIQDIEDKDIKEINELLARNDEYYLKKAIDKLERLIVYIKNTSESIQNEYDTFDKLAREWKKIKLADVSEKKLSDINDKIKKASLLINKHSLEDIKRANGIMMELIKDNK